MTRFALVPAALTAVSVLVGGLQTAVSDALFDGDPTVVGGLASSVASDALARPDPSDFHTGSERFDGEWAVVTCAMAEVGIERALAVDPSRHDGWLPGVRACADVLADPAVHGFALEPWGSPEAARGRAALGYVARGLGSARRLDPDFPHGDLHDRLVADLADRVARDGILALETYPGERYPADQSVVLAAIAAHPDRALYGGLLAKATAEWRGAIDPVTGIACQTVGPDGSRGIPRGSGSTFASLWLAEVDPALAAELHAAAERHLSMGFLGWGALREHPHGVRGSGDIDSGPLILGTSMSATAFGLAGASVAGDRVAFRRSARTALWFGAPHPTASGWRFGTGMNLGNAVLLVALLPPVS